MRISKKVREEAALICQLAASNAWVVYFDPRMSGVAQFAWDLPAVNLAIAAWLETGPAQDRLAYGPFAHLGMHEAPWAEAEALLRTGWTP